MSDRVQQYFAETASEFDAIHTKKRGWFDATVDRIFRPGMQERFAYVVDHAAQQDNASLLDVGCGGGKYGVALAQRGLAAVGIDFAPTMIDLARTRAEQAGVADRCRWLVGDVMQEQLDTVDVVLAIGVFDYVRDAEPLLERLRELTGKELIASFPRAGTWQGVLRRIWLKTKNCPVYYYRADAISKMTAEWDGQVEIIRNIRGDYLLHWRKARKGN